MKARVVYVYEDVKGNKGIRNTECTFAHDKATPDELEQCKADLCKSFNYNVCEIVCVTET